MSIYDVDAKGPEAAAAMATVLLAEPLPSSPVAGATASGFGGRRSPYFGGSATEGADVTASDALGRVGAAGGGADGDEPSTWRARPALVSVTVSPSAGVSSVLARPKSSTLVWPRAVTITF